MQLTRGILGTMKMLTFAGIGLAMPFICTHAAEDRHNNKTRIQLGDQVLYVDVADTQDKRRLGMMYRKSLSEDEGMLFVFPESKRRMFWMKNTFIPLSVGIFDENRRLLEILDLDLPILPEQSHFPVITSQHSARYVLEVRQGWFDQNHVQSGSIFKVLDD